MSHSVQSGSRLAIAGELALVVVTCSFFALLTLSFAHHSSATFDEPTRLSAGLTYLRWHDYRLNSDHPPLAKKLVALPLLSQSVWPTEINPATNEQPLLADWRSLPDNRSVLKSAWVAATSGYDQQWIFGHCYLYGVRDETLARLREANPSVTGPYTVPTTERLTKADFYNDPDALLFRARAVVMSLGILLAVLIYLWSRALFGTPGAALSLFLFCCDPNLIAHSGLVTGDVALALFIFGAVYFLWRLCNGFHFVSALLFVVCFALAFVTKFSAVVLLVIFWPTVIGRLASQSPWPVSRVSRNSGIKLETFWRQLIFFVALFSVAVVTTILAIWASYEFRYSAMRNGGAAPSFPIAETLYREAALKTELQRLRAAGLPEERGDIETRIAEVARTRPLTLTGRIILFAAQHRLLPEAYLYGLAHARIDPLMRTSFLRGQYSATGFRTSYLWAFLLKTPLPALLAILAAIIACFTRGIVRTWNFGFIASAVAICSLSVSMFAPVNIAHRYLLQIYPFLYLLSGALGVEWARLSVLARRLIAIAAVFGIVLSSQFVFCPPWDPQRVHPHYLAYFNEIAGGPRNGYKNLVDSNLDWGQELNDLRKWLDDRNITEPIWLSYFGTADARWHQIPHISVPKVLGGYLFEASPYSALEDSGAADKAVRNFINDLRPGQYLAVSATNLAGVYLGAQARDVWQHLLASCTYVDQVGYSLFIYRIGDVPRLARDRSQ